jgi:hypothetical protein
MRASFLCDSNCKMYGVSDFYRSLTLFTFKREDFNGGNDYSLVPSYFDRNYAPFNFEAVIIYYVKC